MAKTAKTKKTTAKKATKKTAKTKTKKSSTPKKKATVQDDDDSRRDTQRVPVQLLVDYQSNGNYLFDFCKDLGTGGVFIQTEKPLPIGSSLDLTFTIPDSRETLVTHGEVIWVQDAVATRKEASAGMGIQFSKFNEKQRKTLDEFVTRYHGNKFIAEERGVKKSA